MAPGAGQELVGLGIQGAGVPRYLDWLFLEVQIIPPYSLEGNWPREGWDLQRLLLNAALYPAEAATKLAWKETGMLSCAMSLQYHRERTSVRSNNCAYRGQVELVQGSMFAEPWEPSRRGELRGRRVNGTSLRALMAGSE